MTDYIALADALADYATGDEFQRPVEEAERVIRALGNAAPADYIALAREVGAYVSHSTIGGDPKHRTRHYALDANQLAAFAARIAQAAQSDSSRPHDRASLPAQPPVLPRIVAGGSPSDLLKDLRWRMDDIREMLMSRGVGEQRIYGCDEWSTPTVNLQSAIDKIDAALAFSVFDEGDVPSQDREDAQDALNNIHRFVMCWTDCAYAARASRAPAQETDIARLILAALRMQMVAWNGEPEAAGMRQAIASVERILAAAPSAEAPVSAAEMAAAISTINGLGYGAEPSNSVYEDRLREFYAEQAVTSAHAPTGKGAPKCWNENVDRMFNQFEATITPQAATSAHAPTGEGAERVGVRVLRAVAEAAAHKQQAATGAPDALAVLQDLIDHVDAITCRHEDTHRGGIIWTICDDCGDKWADDLGGFKPYKDAPAVDAARKVLSDGASRAGQPTDEQIMTTYDNKIAKGGSADSVILRTVRAFAGIPAAPVVETWLPAELSEQWRWSLHTFLDVAAGEGYTLGGVDAAELYEAVFPDQ